MNVNLKLEGELENFITSMVIRGLAANKTDAIRMAVVRYYEHAQEEARADEAFNRASMKNAWDNPKDEEASKFYIQRYLNGKKARNRPG